MTEEIKDGVEQQELVEEPTEQVENKEPELKYSDDDLNRIIDQKFKKFQEKKEKEIKALEEAQKLESMTQEEQIQHSLEQLQKELDTYKQREQLSNMKTIARNKLSEVGVNAKEELLDILVTTDADQTNVNLNAFASLYQDAVDAGIEEALKGKSPQISPTSTTEPKKTKQEILSIKDGVKRRAEIAKHPELFKI